MRSKETRMERMNKQLMRDYSEIIRDELKLPESFKLLSITHVELYADQSAAKVYVSHLKEGHTGPAVAALNNEAGLIRSHLRTRLAWRKIPSATFFEDDSLKRGFDMIRKIERLTAQSGSSQPEQDVPCSTADGDVQSSASDPPA